MTTGLVLTFDAQLTQVIALVDEDGNARRGTATSIAGALPIGSYLDQPLVWDGTSYVPSPQSVASERFHAVNDASTFWSLATPVLGFPTDALLSIESSTAIQVRRDSTAGTTTTTFVAGSTVEPLQLVADDAGAPMLGALGATPVVRQILTASLASPQAQIDDIVAALVALGFVTDSRVP
jgi:hypothetical protein